MSGPNFGHRLANGIGQGFAGIVGGLGADPFLRRFRNYSGHGITGPFGQAAFYAADAGRHLARFGANGLGQGLGLAGQGVRAIGDVGGGYNTWRKQAAMQMRHARISADLTSKFGVGAFPKHTNEIGNPLMRGRDADYVMKKYGKQANGFRRFGARSPGEHMKKGMHNIFNLKYGAFSAMALGLNLGVAGLSSDDNIFDPYNGVARSFATNVGAEVGFAAGGAIGATLAAALVPGGFVAAAIGFIGGGLIGSEAGSGVTDLPWKFSEFGNKYGRRSIERKSQFQDSEYAATMRQRAMQSISRSHMNARSAFGQEALAYHA